jgi:hypothetical protein
MQPPEFSEASYRTSVYQVARRTLIWTWWKRLMFTPRTIIALSIWAAMAVGCMFLPGNFRFFAILPALFFFLAPVNVYQLYAKTVDSEPQLTDQKTLEFGPSRLVVTGPDWKTEVTWRRFRGLSEDEEFFYLHLQRSQLPVMFPKSAFTPDQQERFREWASATGELVPDSKHGR